MYEHSGLFGETQILLKPSKSFEGFFIHFPYHKTQKKSKHRSIWFEIHKAIIKEIQVNNYYNEYTQKNFVVSSSHWCWPLKQGRNNGLR